MTVKVTVVGMEMVMLVTVVMVVMVFSRGVAMEVHIVLFPGPP